MTRKRILAHLDLSPGCDARAEAADLLVIRAGGAGRRRGTKNPTHDILRQITVPLMIAPEPLP